MIKASIQLNKILSDKTSGSSEILLKINRLVSNNIDDREFVSGLFKTVRKSFAHFSAINNYIDELEKLFLLYDDSRLRRFVKDFELSEINKYERIFTSSLPFLKNIGTVLTISNSKTLLHFFSLWRKQNRKLKVIICESRPRFEGRILAKNLLKENIKVELITEASAAFHINNVDAVITGADSVLSNGNVVNKTGSQALAVLCKYYKKPFYVVTTKEKFIRRKTFSSPSANPDEVWKPALQTGKSKNKNLVVRNIYFEIIEKKLITKIFTD